MRRLLLPLITALACMTAAGSAQAFSPEAQVTGSSTSKWYSGSLAQQWGTNCATAVLGSSYPEVMTSSIGSYGGSASGGLVTVGAKYWVSVLISIPGNPCGSGSAAVQTDLVLPPGTGVDPTRQIQCFGKSRAANTFDSVLTGQTWAAFGLSGKYCPAQVSPSPVAAGGVNVGSRLLASGQMFQLFVPVTSSSPLGGTGGAVFDWLITSSAAYESPALSRTQAYVFSGFSGGAGPQVFFSRTPSASPFWQADASTSPSDTRNRAEFWVNVYTAGLGGTLSYEIRRTDISPNPLVWSSAQAGAAFNGAVAAGQDVVQVIPGAGAAGPQGGYVPVSFDPPGEWNVPMRIIWKFTPSSGSPVTNSADFRTLAGPDTDGDGVADAADACPTVAGNGANGCTPTAAFDPDLDGKTGADDLCPTVAAVGTPDGCPAPAAGPVPGNPPGTEPPPASPAGTPGSAQSAGVTAVGAVAAPLTASLGLKKNPSLSKRSLTGKGAAVAATCTAGAGGVLSLVATKSTAKALGLGTKPLPMLGSATAVCAAGSTPFKLTLGKKVASKLKKVRAGVKLTATLTLVATRPGSAAATASASVRIK